MATKTKSRNSATPKIEDFSHNEKHCLARGIVKAIKGPCKVYFSEKADLQYGLFDDDQPSAVGHVWYVETEEIDGENDLKCWVVDDRDGDIRKLIANSFRERAALFIRWAERVEAVELPVEEEE